MKAQCKTVCNLMKDYAGTSGIWQVKVINPGHAVDEAFEWNGRFSRKAWVTGPVHLTQEGPLFHKRFSSRQSCLRIRQGSRRLQRPFLATQIDPRMPTGASTMMVVVTVIRA
jgi:hypothetical protein